MFPPPCLLFASLRKPIHNLLILRRAQWHKAPPCASERSSDSSSSAHPPQAGFPPHSTTTPSWHELCAYLSVSASLRGVYSLFGPASQVRMRLPVLVAASTSTHSTQIRSEQMILFVVCQTATI